jgi:uncharacterized protein (DUF1697 family)
MEYVAFLRGVNVGAHNRIGMGPLRDALAARGFDNPRTHGQSGNLLLSSRKGKAAVLAAVEECLAEDVGKDIRVVLRTRRELAAAVDADPLADVADDPSRHFIVFLSQAPKPVEVRRVRELDVAPERVEFGKREAYLWCPHGLRDSKLGRLKLDERLAPTGTMRNLRTVTKMLELAG